MGIRSNCVAILAATAVLFALPAHARFLQTDPIGSKDDLDLYAYTAEDPVNRTDPTGTEAPCVTNNTDCGVHITGQDVKTAVNLADKAQTVLMVVDPLVGAIEKIAVKTVEKVAEKVVEKEVTKTAEKTVAEKAAGKETGSYTNTHESGKEYHGKGDRERSQTSGRRVERETGDGHAATEFRPASSERQAFKDEASRIKEGGGPESPDNYNKINSPGAKYTEEDGGP